MVKLTEEGGEKYLVALFTRGFTSAADLLPDDASAKGLFRDIGSALAAIMGPEQLRNAVASKISASPPWQAIQGKIKAAIEADELNTIAQEAVQEAAASLRVAETPIRSISDMSLDELRSEINILKEKYGDIPAFLIKNPDDRERAQALEKSLREREHEARATTVQNLPGFLKDYPRTQTRPAPSTSPPSASVSRVNDLADQKPDKTIADADEAQS